MQRAWIIKILCTTVGETRADNYTEARTAEPALEPSGTTR
jgi:hypothetical protein